MVERIRYIRQRIKLEEFWSFWKLLAFCVKKIFESPQFFLKFLLRISSRGINWMNWENSEVDVQIELQFLANNVILTERKCNKSIPRYEKVFTFPKVKCLKV